MNEIAFLRVFAPSKGKSIRHGVERHKDTMISYRSHPLLPIFGITPITLKSISFSRIVLPTAGWPGNIFFSNSHPTYRDPAIAGGIVLVVEPAPSSNRHVANIAVLGNHAENLPVGGSVIAYRADVVALQHGRTARRNLA